MITMIIIIMIMVMVDPPGGRGLGSNHAWMCVSKSEGNGSFFSLQGSEMIEKISLKMGVKFAASLNMGKNLW